MMKRELSGGAVQRVARDFSATQCSPTRESPQIEPEAPVGSAIRKEIVGALLLAVGEYLDGAPDAALWLKSEEAGEHFRAIGLPQSGFIARLREIERDPALRAKVSELTHRHRIAANWLHAVAAISRAAA